MLAYRTWKLFMLVASHLEQPRLQNRLASIGIPLCLLAILATLVHRAVVAETQIDWDEELYFQIAHFWKQGLLPYRDIFDHKPPMVYLFYMATSWADQIFTVRLVVTGMLIGSITCLFGALLHRSIITKQNFIILTPALFCILSYNSACGSNTESIYAPLVMLSFALLLRERLLPSALCAAFALAIKYTVALDILGVGVTCYLLEQNRDERLKRALIWASMVLVVSLGIYAAFYLYFRANGIDLIDEIVVRNIKHASSAEIFIFDSESGLIRFSIIAAPTVIAFALLSAFRLKSVPLFIGATLWLLASAVQGCITRQYYFHYFYPTWIPLILICGSMKFDGRLLVPLLLGLIAFEGFEINNSYQWLTAYERLTRQYHDICGAINNRGYVLTDFLASYRVCHAPSVDKFVFPPFYTDEHFASVSGSGGLAALRSKIERGEVRSLISISAALQNSPALAGVGEFHTIRVPDSMKGQVMY